jgi:hypothetical protein
MLLLATTTVAPSTTREVVVVSVDALVVEDATVVATVDDAAASVVDGSVDAVSSPPLQAAINSPLARANETIRLHMITSIADLFLVQLRSGVLFRVR